MLRKRKIEYESLNRNYSYGSLALNIWDGVDEAEEIPKIAVKETQTVPKRNRRRFSDAFSFKKPQNTLVKDEVVGVKSDNAPFSQKTIMLKTHAFAMIMIMILANLGCVIINHMIMNVQSNLVELQRTERELIGYNNELRIAVEELKGPERIRDIAMKDLGMVVARENIYVRASKSRTIGEIYGKAVEEENSSIYAMLKR